MKQPIPETLGGNIQKARKAAHMTQRSLAAAIGKSYSLINKYESNSTQPPIDVLMKIADALGVDYVTLIGFSDYGIPANELHNLTDEEYELFSKIQLLDEKVKRIIKFIVDEYYELP